MFYIGRIVELGHQFAWDEYTSAMVKITELGGENGSAFGPMPIFVTRPLFLPTFTGGALQPGGAPVDTSNIPNHLHSFGGGIDYRNSGGEIVYNIGDVVIVGQVGHVRENLCILGNLSWYQAYGSGCGG